MNKVAVLGWYGHQNLGDTLILEGIKNLFRGWEIIPMSTAKTSTVPKVDIKTINKCDLLVIGGGELIHTDRLFIHAPSLYNVKIPNIFHRVANKTGILNDIEWIKQIQIPKVILGCGVNAENYSALKPHVLNELKQFDYIGLRDNESVSILNNSYTLRFKTHLFYDLAFSTNFDEFEEPIKSENRVVVIPTDRCTFSDRGVQQNNIVQISLEWLKLKINEPRIHKYNEIVFLPFGVEDNDDYSTCRTMSDYIINSRTVNPANITPISAFKWIASARAVFPYRLHGMIIAFILGKKYDFYPYHWKLRRVHETISNKTVRTIRLKQKNQFDRMLKKVGIL